MSKCTFLIPDQLDSIYFPHSICNLESLIHYSGILKFIENYTIQIENIESDTYTIKIKKNLHNTHK